MWVWVAKIGFSRVFACSKIVFYHEHLLGANTPNKISLGNLKKMEYFGKFGKILKVVINPTPSYAGTQVTLTKKKEKTRLCSFKQA